MNKKAKSIFFYFVVAASVIYPALYWYQNVNSFSFGKVFLFDLFPVLGLLAFSIMWTHVVAGAFVEKIEKFFNYKKYLTWSSAVVFVLIILHPLLALVALVLNGGSAKDIFSYGKPIYLWLAIIAFPVLVAYDVAKKFRYKKFLNDHWQKVRLVSTLAFFLTFFHSLGIGRDLQSGDLRTVWIFYGASAALAAIYTYAIKKR